MQMCVLTRALTSAVVTSAKMRHTCEGGAGINGGDAGGPDAGVAGLSGGTHAARQGSGRANRALHTKSHHCLSPDIISYRGDCMLVQEKIGMRVTSNFRKIIVPLLEDEERI